jgi:DNA-3-methyladenine glycosylase II
MMASISTVATLRTELAPTAPYSFDLALKYLRDAPSAVLERIGADGVYRRALTLDGRDVLLALRSLGTVEAPRLELMVMGADVGDALMERAAALIRHTFALNEDPAPFLALAERDPTFGALIRRHYGLRPAHIPLPFEALLCGVLGQQINVAFARKLKLALYGLAGRTLTIGDVVYPLLPEPAAVATLEVEALRERQISRSKAAYIIGLAQAVASGELDFAALAALPHADAQAALTRFTGVGRWTAEYILMRGLGARDSIPAADAGLRAAIGRAYSLGRNATESEVRQRAEVWAGWRGWATFYWWFSLQYDR